PTPTPAARREAKRQRDMRAYTSYRQRQLEAGKYQSSFWVTLDQAAAIRTWLAAGGDTSIFTDRAPDIKGDNP
ncbi:hypothetical protein OW716_09340, partial [Acidithiobacillus ferriphilus]